MNRQPIPVTPNQFKSFLVPATALLYTLSALLGIVGVVLLFDPEYAALLVQDRIAGGVQTVSALQMWYVIDTVITLLCFLCPLLIAWGIWTAHRGRYLRGLGFLASFAQWALRSVYASSALVLGIFLFRMIRYIIWVLPYNEAVYYIYSLLVSEGLMAVQAWLIWRVLCKFLRDAGDCALSMAYTLSSRKLDSAPIPAFPATGLLVLGLSELALALDRVFTFTIIPNYVQDTYKILVAEHPGQYLAAAALVTGAVGNFLLCAYLRHYNRVCERTRFQANRKKVE